MKPIDLSGRVALVTGAGTGLGRSHALALARRGAAVVVNDLFPRGRADAPSETSTVDAIREKGGRATWLQGDVADPSDAMAMIDAVVKDHGRLDILINNAGVQNVSSFAEMEMAAFARVISVHLLGSANMTRAAWPIMMRQNYGRVIFTTSSTIFGCPGQTAYSAAKAGMIGLMTNLAVEGEEHGIRVNAIAPCARAKDLENAFSDEFLEAMAPEPVSEGVVYLASEDAPQRSILYAGGGGYSTLHLMDSGGLFIGSDVSADDIRSNFAEIDRLSSPTEYQFVTDHITKFNAAIGISKDIYRSDWARQG